MPTVQVVLDAKLLKAADSAARRRKVSRSALVREALREHLKRIKQQDLVERERPGYLAQPQREEEYLPWLEIAAWPKD